MKVVADSSYGVVAIIFDNIEDKENTIKNLQNMADDALIYASFAGEISSEEEIENYLLMLKKQTGDNSQEEF